MSIAAELNNAAAWHGDKPPFGTTGDFTLDMQLADAFRALLYRNSTNERLQWLFREVSRPRQDQRYLKHLYIWFHDIFEAEKAPVIEQRTEAREHLCATL